MTAHGNHAGCTAFECVDSDPETVTGGGISTNGALLYFVKADCDGEATTEHCLPYNAQKPITCVNCSK